MLANVGEVNYSTWRNELMGKTNIRWTDETWNPITGCTPVSAGCVNFYAKKHAVRLEGNPNPKVAHKYRNGFKPTVHPQYLEEPFGWRKPRMVFVNSMSDTFHKDVPEEFIRKLFETMAGCPQHIFQVLTKRADRMADLSGQINWPDNVWAGVTVESAEYLDRMDQLRRVPAQVRFISFEPLLGPIREIDFQGIHWAIVAGESVNAGRKSRRWAWRSETAAPLTGLFVIEGRRESRRVFREVLFQEAERGVFRHEGMDGHKSPRIARGSEQKGDSARNGDALDDAGEDTPASRASGLPDAARASQA